MSARDPPNMRRWLTCPISTCMVIVYHIKCVDPDCKPGVTGSAYRGAEFTRECYCAGI